MRKALLLFFALGFFSLLSQTLIIREFIVSFGGNELGVGLFYFFWLFWVGIGAILALSALGKFLYKHFLKFLFFYPIVSFIQIILFITLRGFANLSWWEFFTFERIFLYLFLFTSFTSLFTGVIFTLGIMWAKKTEESLRTKSGLDDSAIVASSYIFESLGSFFAGGVVTFFIIRLFAPASVLLIGSLFFAFVAFVVSIFLKDKGAIVLHSAFLILLIIFTFHSKKFINFFQQLRMKNLLPTAEFVNETYSPYQHILVGRLSSQLVVLSNGEIVTNIPEEIDADRESALFIAQADSVENILILGAGTENVIGSLLKFPVKNITYVIEDQVYYQTVQRNLPWELKEKLKDGRLKVIFESPRLFLKENGSADTDTTSIGQKRQKFDLAVIYTADPSNLVVNTFFTKEFYALLKRNLHKTGIVATRITSAENFIGQELINYGSSLYYTLGEVFPRIVVVPGKINWFLAGDNQAPLTEDPLVLEDRLKRNVAVQFSFSPQGFRSMFLKRRVQFTKDIYSQNPLFHNTNLRNRDSQPLTFFLNLLVLARYSNSYLIKFFKNAYLVGASIFLVPLLLLFLGRLRFLLKIENIQARRLAFNGKLFQFASGFLGFSFHLTLIFLFQNKFGTIFQLIGLVNSLFMLGLCGGGILGRTIIKKGSSIKAIIGVLSIQGVIILSAYPLFVHSLVSTSPAVQFSLFVIFFLFAGMFTGSSYPLAAKIFEMTGSNLRTTAARLELLDHWGGSLAGILTGLFLLPLLGIAKSLLFLFIISFILIILFLGEVIPLKVLAQERKPRVLSFPYIRTSYILVIIVLSFVINSYLLQRKDIIWKGTALSMFKVQENCFTQTDPFFAQVCETRDKRKYILESKNYAPHIKGFSGPINCRIIIDSLGYIDGIKVIEHKESPSYIAEMDTFVEQFKGRNVREAFSLEAIDAISGATITSQAIVDIVNEVGLAIGNNLGEKTSAGDLIPSEKSKAIVFDKATVVLLVFTLLAVAFHISPHNTFLSSSLKTAGLKEYLDRQILRKIYLFLVVIVLGFSFNLSFSFAHLANLLTQNLPLLEFSSVFLIYLVPLFLGVFFGQMWCGWLCPFGALQEILAFTSFHKRPSMLYSRITPSLDRKARYFKYVFLAIFIIIICVQRDARLFTQEPLSIFFLNPSRIGWDKLLSFVVLFFSLFFFRFWCRYFCVCGAFLSLFNKIGIFNKFFTKKYNNCPLGVKDYHDIDCIQCNACMPDK
ncbi:MAG: FMN-binding protein [Candidatus Omnitrophota bacterium]|nr:MAG: FMN-binding protein [Candidatus Omnitrophota bacterium]